MKPGSARKTPPKKASTSSTPMKQQSLLSFFSPPTAKKTDSTPSSTEKTQTPVPKTSPRPPQATPTTTKSPPPVVEFTPKRTKDSTESDSVTSDSDEDVPLAKKRKRLVQSSKKSIEVSDDDEAEWNDKDVDMESSDDDVSLVDSNDESEEDTKPIKKKQAPASKSSKTPPKKPQQATHTVTPNKPKEESSTAMVGTLRLHDSWPWLNADRRDKQGRKPDHPEYDSRTIRVPEDFLRKETPAMQQWWDVKQNNMDTVLFFKVGKFYELFHMDADVGFKELNLNYMKGEKAHNGFPEIAYAKFSAQLVSRGYRVARVEQTETPEMMKARGGKSKVVKREICSLLTPGTNTINFLDGSPVGSSTTSSYLLTIKEQVKPELEFGVCLVDCTTGAFHLGQFTDSQQRDRLRTLLAQFHVVEIVIERQGVSTETKAVLTHGASHAVRTELKAGTEMWDAVKTVREIQQAGYFEQWPETLESCLEIDKSVKAEYLLAVSALGGCVWNLRRSLIDQELLSLRQFHTYYPPDTNVTGAKKAVLTQQYVVLDGHSIHNLELLRNNYNGQRQGSLLAQLDQTVTNFGKRLFEDWLLKPLCSVDAINSRLDAVQALIPQHSLVVELRAILKSMPDLERLLSRIHALGIPRQDHPDSRAIMYEVSAYNVRKVKDFVAVLTGFHASLQVVKKLRDHSSWKSAQILTHWLSSFPDLKDKLAFFDHAFDQKVALKTGTIQPQANVDAEYDDAIAEVAKVESDLEEYLQEQRKNLKCKNIVYWGSKKEDRYQLEVPESAVASKQPAEYDLKSKKKGFKRFHTKYIRDCLSRLSAAEDRREAALKDSARRMFAKFDESYSEWKQAVHQLAILDCLMSLSLVSGQSEGYTRPEFVLDDEPFLDIQEGRHPSIASSVSDFIPNDTKLGKDSGAMMLLSGPNMGGKSTLLRQTCTLVLMAQMGCFVPAASCRLTPVDRIFTRLGASDRILAGQSTLFVELAETATILNHASKHSLVILDELGRGTSTFDGTAIAYGVVEHLLHNTGSRTMFATHYHSLVEEYIGNPNVVLGHMDCMVDPDNEQKVVFLYKLANGICPKSYGLNVATLADLPQEVIDMAATKSQQFEELLQDSNVAMQVRQALDRKDVRALRQLWHELSAK
ncbi:DNA mismatch repair protein msh6 [Aphanomyces cochlioides]|nr:DNA mismatch repair protein msh6 [Aphanomyces cochlioides]